MKQDALFLGDLADLLDRVDRADLVVGQHDRNQDGFVRDRVPHVVRADHAALVHREIGDLEALPGLQGLGGIQHSPVLGRVRDDMVSLFVIHLHDALERQIVRFRGPAGEHDFFGVGMDEARDLLPRLLDGFLAFPAKGVVPAGPVTEFLGEIREHHLEDAWVRGGRRMTIQVNGELHRLTPSIAGIDWTVIMGALPPMMSSMVMPLSS